MRFDKTGLDVGVGYNQTDPAAPVAATIYVYPAPPLISTGSPASVIAAARQRLCKGEFERRKAELAAAHPGAALVEEKDVLLQRGGRQVAGKRAIYDYEAQFGGKFTGPFTGVRVPVSSQVYVFCYVGGKWAIQYRFTSPRAVGSSGVIASFLADLPWTIPEA